MDYVERVADAELARRLRSAGAVLLEGAKACGKTATAMQLAASSVLLDVDGSARLAARTAPDLLLAGPAPRLIDEWQLVPEVWNHVRRAVDDRREKGQFILTGSATPVAAPERHTGAGRFSILRMRPMSLYEAGVGTGEVSLADLFDGVPARAPAGPLGVERLADLVTVGGWPAQQGLDVLDAAAANRDYLAHVRDIDIARIDSPRRDRRRVGALLASLGRNVATEATLRSLGSDAAVDSEPLDGRTVDEYLGILERLMIIEEQPPWEVHLRSKARLRRAPKRHFVDPSLAVAALGASPRQLLDDLNLLGLLFESLVVRDLRVLSGPLDGTVLHYRDSNGIEVDAVVVLGDGRWGAFEIKLGDGLASDGARSLSRFRDAIDTRRCGEPSVLGVICGTGYGYRRDDGIDVIPAASLRP